MEYFSEDPIGFAGGDANLYRYVGNKVTGATDPSGLVETWPMEELIKRILNDPNLTDRQKRWKIQQLVRGCIGLTCVMVGQTENHFPSFDTAFDNPQDAADEVNQLKSIGKEPLVFSVHFWSPDPLTYKPDGSVDMDKSFDPNRTRPPWKDTDSDGDIDSDDRRGVNFDFGVLRSTKYGMRWVHADMYHNPDKDNDSVGDHYPTRKIREATILISTFDEWRDSYEDFNREVWCVVSDPDPGRCISR